MIPLLAAYIISGPDRLSGFLAWLARRALFSRRQWQSPELEFSYPAADRTWSLCSDAIREGRLDAEAAVVISNVESAPG